MRRENYMLLYRKGGIFTMKKLREMLIRYYEKKIIELDRAVLRLKLEDPSTAYLLSCEIGDLERKVARLKKKV